MTRLKIMVVGGIPVIEGAAAVFQAIAAEHDMEITVLDCLCPMEARARIPEANMVIIDLGMNEAVSIIVEALAAQLPITAIGYADQLCLAEMLRIPLILKPAFRVEHFREMLDGSMHFAA